MWRLIWISLVLLISCNGNGDPPQTTAHLTEMEKAYIRVEYGDILANYTASTRTVTDSLSVYIRDRAILLEEEGGQLWFVMTDKDSIFWLTPERAGRNRIQYFPYLPSRFANARAVGWVEQIDIYAPTDSSTIQYFPIFPDTTSGDNE